MSHPIETNLQGVFMPVSDIVRARDWYCRLLNLPNDGEIFFGHIYVLPMSNGVNIILDSQIYTPEHVFKVPCLQIATNDIEQAWQHVKQEGIEVLTDIQNNQWFNIKDIDGNVLMICRTA